MTIRLNSLTSKFIGYLVPVMVLILGASGYYNHLYVKQALENSLASKAESKLTSLVSMTAYFLQNFETDLVDEMVASVQAEDEVAFIAVRNKAGIVKHGKVVDGDSVHVFRKPISTADEDFGQIEIGLYTSRYAATVRRILVTNAAILLLILLITTFSIVIFVRKRLINPITTVNLAMKKMESGDLNERLAIDSKDEIATMKKYFNTMSGSLGKLVNSIQGNSLQIKHSAHQVATISSEINDMADIERRSSVEVTTASSELFEISGSVANLAQEAKKLATDVDQQARTGLQAALANISEMENAVNDVNRASSEMDELNGTAQSIHAIVDTIKSIAEQTNLLALNAAIEAARAGEQGRGFAVVADEVRTLAAKTTGSVDEISGIVNQLTRKVENSDNSLRTVVQRVHSGQKQASVSAGSIESITDAISAAVSANTKILDATGEQHQRLNILHERLSSFTTSMAKSAVKASTTAMVGNELYKTAEELSQLLEKFSINVVDRGIPRNDDERRGAPRINHKLRVQATQGATIQEGVTGDLSMTGLKVELQGALDERSTVGLHIYLPQKNLEGYKKQTPLEVKGTIVWKKSLDERYRYGIRFEPLNTDQKAQIENVFEYFGFIPEFKKNTRH